MAVGWEIRKTQGLIMLKSGESLLSGPGARHRPKLGGTPPEMISKFVARGKLSGHISIFSGGHRSSGEERRGGN